MPNVTEKKVRVRFIREQIELYTKQREELSPLYEDEYDRGQKAAYSDIIETLERLLNDCAE